MADGIQLISIEEIIRMVDDDVRNDIEQLQINTAVAIVDDVSRATNAL